MAAFQSSLQIMNSRCFYGHILYIYWDIYVTWNNRDLWISWIHMLQNKLINLPRQQLLFMALTKKPAVHLCFLQIFSLTQPQAYLIDTLSKVLLLEGLRPFWSQIKAAFDGFFWIQRRSQYKFLKLCHLIFLVWVKIRQTCLKPWNSYMGIAAFVVVDKLKISPHTSSKYILVILCLQCSKPLSYRKGPKLEIDMKMRADSKDWKSFL